MSEPEKKTFLVRQNCEYSITVEAVDEEDACSQANAEPLGDWGTAWSSMEAEEDCKPPMLDAGLLQ